MDLISARELPLIGRDLISTYSKGIVRYLQNSINLQRHFKIADFSIYSALLASLFIQAGHEVHSVESNPNFRYLYQQAEEARLVIEQGSIERNGLPSAYFDLITVAQAFDGFNPQTAVNEFRRILKPSGHILLSWTQIERVNPACDACIALQRRHLGASYVQPAPDSIALKDIFSPAPVICNEFRVEQGLGKQSFRALMLSLLSPAIKARNRLLPVSRDIDQCFLRFSRGGMIDVAYTHRLCMMPNLS